MYEYYPETKRTWHSKKFYLAEQQRLVIFAAVLTYERSSSYSHFLFIYKHSIQNTFILVQNLFRSFTKTHRYTLYITGNCLCFAFFWSLSFFLFLLFGFFFQSLDINYVTARRSPRNIWPKSSLDSILSSEERRRRHFLTLTPMFQA